MRSSSRDGFIIIYRVHLREADDNIDDQCVANNTKEKDESIENLRESQFSRRIEDRQAPELRPTGPLRVPHGQVVLVYSTSLRRVLITRCGCCSPPGRQFKMFIVQRPSMSVRIALLSWISL